MKKKRAYWYMRYVYECPLCGRGKTYRERMYTKKPKDWNLRNSFKDRYDYCDV